MSCNGRALDGPFIALLEQDGTDQANDGVFIEENADHLGPPLDGLVECGLAQCSSREAHIGEHVDLGFIHESGELWQFGAELIGDLTPLSPGRFGPALLESPISLLISQHHTSLGACANSSGIL
jgi:hypothetical protein